MIMEKLLKKIVYTGVGFVSLTVDKMSETVKELMKDGKISEKEGKKLIEDFSNNTGEKKDEVEKQFKKLVDKVLKSLNYVRKSEVDKLEERLADLEKQLEKKAKPKTNKKTSTKKTTAKKPPKKTK